jgi:subtilisin family serine protease
MSAKPFPLCALLPIGWALSLVIPAALPALAQQPPQQKPAPGRSRVERADQLPRHMYSVSTTAVALFQDDRQFSALARQLERDLRADLAAYDIQDRATLKSFYGTLSGLALERADYRTAVAYQDSVRAIEDKPGLRLLTGIVERSMATTTAVGERVDTARLRAAFRREIAALPYPQVQAELTVMNSRLGFATTEVALGTVQSEIEPAARSHSISRELAQRLVAVRTMSDRIAPVRAVLVSELSQTIAAHSVLKPDIWAARDVSLEGSTDLTPVTIAIWDSGVDVDVFPDQLFTNQGEIAGNGKDDDGNGYVDDVHGIRHDEDGGRTTGTLQPISLTPAEVTEYRGYIKGALDNQAGLNTPDAEAFKRKIGTLAPADFKPFREKLQEYVIKSHGTHVAGIALRGNPAARMLVATMTDDQYKLPPRAPTLEWAHGSAHELTETVDYFRQHGVRVVNMSWGFAPSFFEATLEANNVGTPEERKKLAREIHDIGATALREAIRQAPDILFVAAAGNWDQDNKFGEFVPAAWDLPNLITAAAVDRAGDEAAFTSYGKVDVYANGYEVTSQVPGGAAIPLSGTSMAAPQVVNLAAKLLAVKPTLTVAELRRAIVDAADERTIGQGKRIKLLNPRASMALVEKK